MDVLDKAVVFIKYESKRMCTFSCTYLQSLVPGLSVASVVFRSRTRAKCLATYFEKRFCGSWDRTRPDLQATSVVNFR